MAKVTIGMPLYNNAATVSQALTSLLGQTFTDFVIVISDDGSTDGTADICRSYAVRDGRITFFAQPKNLNYGNFRYLVQQASTDYFMWAAGDDWWDATVIEKELAVLEYNPDVVCCVPKVMFVKDGLDLKESRGTSSLIGSVSENILNYLRAPEDNSRMYGLIRTYAAKKSFPTDDFHAYDWAFSVLTLKYGKHVEIPEVLIRRDHTPVHKYSYMVRRDHEHYLYRIFPLIEFSRYIISIGKIPLNMRTIEAIISLNIGSHVQYIQTFHPIYWKYTGWLAIFWKRHVGWRLHKPNFGLTARLKE
jgi:glycosyltransferase involved in cell wall biosynthesis